VFQLLISEVDGICDVCGIVYPLASVTAKVPLVVIGDPLIDKPVGTVIATLVTDPDPAEALMYVFKSLMATCFIVPASLKTTRSASTTVVDIATVSPSKIFSSAAVAVTPSRMFSSAAVDVTATPPTSQPDPRLGVTVFVPSALLFISKTIVV
jgi:hypothetical protein